MIYDLVRSRLIQYRREHQLTQSELADVLCMALRTYQRLENGDKIKLDINELELIAESLGFDLVAIMLPEKYGFPLNTDVNDPAHSPIDPFIAIIEQQNNTIKELRATIQNLTFQLSSSLY